MSLPTPELDGEDVPKNHNLAKQGLIAAVLTVLLAVGWWYGGQLGMMLINIFRFEGAAGGGMFTLNWLSGSSTWVWLGVGALILSVIWALIALVTLLVPRLWIRLVPVLVAPLVLLLSPAPDSAWQAGVWMVGIAVAAQLFYMSDVRRSLGIFKKLSLYKILMPGSGGLFLGMSVILMVPVYFYLATDTEQVEQIIEQKFVVPQADRLLGPGVMSGLLQGNEINLGGSPGAFIQSLIPEDILQQINRSNDQQINSAVEQLNSEVVDEITTNVNAGLQAKREELKAQAIAQTMEFVRPILAFAYIFIPVLGGLALWQLSWPIRPILFIIPWMAMQLVYLLKIAQVTSRKEPVEYLQI